MTSSTVVVGTGQAGFQVALSLRENGYDRAITLVGDEPEPPYQRPPLSKAFLDQDTPPEDLVTLRPSSFYTDRDISLRIGERAVAVDRERRVVELESGEHLGFGHLVLATGAGAIALSVPGADLDGVLPLRTVHDARSLRKRLRGGGALVVVGGGFVGMEVAAAAAKTGRPVTVLEAADRIMGRVVAPEIGAHLHHRHREHGVEIHTGARVVELLGDRGSVVGVRLAGGEVLPAETVVVGVGVRPRDELARRAGLPVAEGAGGIVVDDALRTPDHAISAIGDCAHYPSPYAGGGTRLESVQNAVDHARHVAARLTGTDPGPYRSVPWFWTHQYDCTVQTAGIGAAEDERYVLGDPTTGRFSVVRFRDGRLACVESVNSAADHIAARKLLGGPAAGPTPQDVVSAGFSLREHLRTGARR